MSNSNIVSYTAYLDIISSSLSPFASDLQKKRFSITAEPKIFADRDTNIQFKGDEWCYIEAYVRRHSICLSIIFQIQGNAVVLLLGNLKRFWHERRRDLDKEKKVIESFYKRYRVWYPRGIGISTSMAWWWTIHPARANRY